METIGSVLLHIPHASTVIPPRERAEIVLSDDDLSRELILQTDHFTDELFSLASQADRLVFPVSRLVVDPERFRDDAAEPMAARGMGAVYLKTHDGRPLRKDLGREELLRQWYDPHHKALDDWTTRALAEHGHALIVDCHSYPSTPLPCDADQNPVRPDACVGTDDYHTPEWLTEKTQSSLASRGWSVDVNRPYAGAICPNAFFEKDRRVQTVMIEVNRRLYLDERSGTKLDGFEQVRSDLEIVLGEIVAEWGRRGNPSGSFSVMVDDNFHHMDEGERYTSGVFGTYEQALSKAKEILGWSLTDVGYRFEHYTMFGDDPWISPSPDRRRFSAWDCAKARCERHTAES